MITQAKQNVWQYWQAFDHPNTLPTVDSIRAFVHDDVIFNGPHPINQLHGVDSLLTDFWQPLTRAFSELKRDADVFMTGMTEEEVWSGGTGYFTGTFSQPWLGIEPTGEPIQLRFGEVCNIRDGKIATIYLILDIIDLSHQIGRPMLPYGAGRHLQRVPKSHNNINGVLLEPQADADTKASYELVHRMVYDGLLQYDQQDLKSMAMENFWSADMEWYGPAGIGSSLTLQEFQEFHQGPFLKGFPDRTEGDANVMFAEGMFVTASGFPGVVATHGGEYLGQAPTNNRINMRVMDWWRRDGDLLVQNWVMIDMIDIFMQFGIDLFETLKTKS